MHNPDPWESIQQAHKAETLSMRRVDASHPLDFFWARNDTGARLLLLKWEGAVPREPEVPQVRGVGIEQAANSLKLILINADDQNIFHVLCQDLIDSTRSISMADRAVEVIFTRLGKWQRLLGRKRKGLLDEFAIRGLLAELWFLRTEMIDRFGAEAIDLWTGPEGTPQDFQLGAACIEIKSRSVSGAPVLQISSAEQLWSEFSDVYLGVYSVGQQPKGSGGLSLRELVDSIRGRLMMEPRAEQFELKLLDAGYMDLPEYLVKEYAISDLRTYEVKDGFPRLVPPGIPDGVLSVNYQIHLESCEPYSVRVDFNELARS